MKEKIRLILILSLMIPGVCSVQLKSQNNKENTAIDEKVRKFLAENSRQWYDMNVPPVDGQLIYDIIIKNNYKTALEIGTSTGHSGIWIAWALSKTGGKLITIDVDEGRHNKAVENFKKAGLSNYIDARLADAHELVKELKGPFDFIFSDADKDWYKNYFIELDPKLETGGCYASHNIRDFSPSYSEGNTGGGPGRVRGRGGPGQGDYLAYLKSLQNYETTVNSNGGGLAISYKKSSK